MKRRGLRAALAAVEPTAGEVSDAMPGDDLVPGASVVMDRAFTVPGEPAAVWPWIVQLGKRRAGWYLPRVVERVVPRSRRAARSIDPRWQRLAVGDVIPDYGGAHETFTVGRVEPPYALVYTSRRGHVDVSWAIRLDPDGRGRTRVRLRLRLGGVRHPRVADSVGDWFDLLTIAGMAAGLRERLEPRP